MSLEIKNNDIRPKISNWIKETVKCWFLKKNKIIKIITKNDNSPQVLKNM